MNIVNTRALRNNLSESVTQRYFIQFSFVIMIAFRCYNGYLICYYIGVNAKFFFLLFVWYSQTKKLPLLIYTTVDYNDNLKLASLELLFIEKNKLLNHK